jgi:uncharacterized protein DUF1549/uncharacterized protein DUF1553
MRTMLGSLRRLGVVTLALIALIAFVSGNGATGQTPEKKGEQKATSAKEDTPKETPAKSPGTSGSGSSVTDADVIAYINQMIEDGWKDNKITPSRYATDHEWLRRVYLDIVGRIPAVQEINDFFAGHSGTSGFGLGKSRAALLKGIAPVETGSALSADKGHPGLLVDVDYAKNWANLWTVWLLTRTSPPGIDREKMRFWLEEQFAKNEPYDKIVTKLITATGKVDTDEGAAANFIASHVGEMTPTGERSRFGLYEMVPVTSRTTKLFLGVQTQCTQCHNHPFIDDRKQNQYWGINAFFRQVEREPQTIGMQRNNQVDRRYTVRDNLKANNELGVFYEQRNGLLLRTSPTYLDGTKLDLGPKDSPHEVNRRAELAHLITKDPYFAKEIVNRMWAHFMGRGFTNPVDDFGEHNPPSHPELLDRLAKDFAATGYNLHRLVYWITMSKPYALSSVANNTNLKSDTDQYFSRMLLKSMTPEQLVDSIFTATNAEQTKTSKEERRKLYDDWMRDFTVNFGDDEGNEATFNGTVVQALLLMNGSKLNETTKTKPGSTVARAATMGTNGINHLFLAALGRPATGSEIAKVRGLAGAGKDPLQDVLWALLNSNEFILNH